jgi:RNA polymerase sigma-70 factor (ECF subfamily)
MTDADLAERALHSHAGALRAWFRRRLASPQDVDDAMQDLCLRLCARDGGTIVNERAYMFETAQRVLADRGRRAKVRQAGKHDGLTESHHPVEELTPERVLMGKDAASAMLRMIYALPDRTRDIFIMNRFENMSYTQIATAAGISVSAVEKHIMKALRILMEGRNHDAF